MTTNLGSKFVNWSIHLYFDIPNRIVSPFWL